MMILMDADFPWAGAALFLFGAIALVPLWVCVLAGFLWGRWRSKK